MISELSCLFNLISPNLCLVYFGFLYWYFLFGKKSLPLMSRFVFAFAHEGMYCKIVIIMVRDCLCSCSGNLFLPHVLHVSLMYLKKKKKKASVWFQTHVLGFSLRHGAFSYQLLQLFFTLITCRHSSGLKDDLSIKSVFI